MSAPPGLAPDACSNLPAPGETAHRADDFLSPRVVAREVVKILAARGNEIRPPVVRRLVTRFIRYGYTTLAEVEPFVLGYLDPTGETAVRNVERERR